MVLICITQIWRPGLREEDDGEGEEKEEEGGITEDWEEQSWRALWGEHSLCRQGPSDLHQSAFRNSA